ncbi:hypothetical protein [Actinomadura sp. HBU206391]|uniref:hypothetical protein n=1 Tax=Actinomadura sp. HBU206391 TaxID=2731692 RepID=UPI0016503039|nr:hypothetical protein [Actinomadura sp. HBU206391]MBC6457565.1 hypothetical protein [Actinomadura sp. HBU206391]
MLVPVTGAMPLAALAGVDEDSVTPGVLGLLVVVALGLALVFLIKSMNKQISRIQAPREQDLKQAEWEQRRANEQPPGNGSGDADDAQKDDGDPQN